MPSRAALAKIHIARKELGFSDESYRDLLHLQFKAESASQLTEQQAAGLLDIFRRKGWKPKKSRQQLGLKRREGRFIEIKQGPAAAQQRKVLALWNALGYDTDQLHTRCNRQFGVDRIEWLTEPKHLHILISDLENRMRSTRRESKR